MKYENLSVALELARKQVKLYEDALVLCPKIMEVVKKFDGKVANKRLGTALIEVNRGISCRKASYTEEWEIVFYTSDRSLNVKSKNWRGVETSNTYYIAQSELYIANDINYNIEKYGSFTDDNGRWKADNICKQITARMETFKEYIRDFEEEISNVDDMKKEKERIKKEIEAYNKKVSWLGNEYFELKI